MPTDQYDIDSAYGEGYGNGVEGYLYSNCYDPNNPNEAKLWEAYEEGFWDGRTDDQV